MLTWTRTNASAVIVALAEKGYTLGKLTLTANYTEGDFSANPAGTMFGSSVIASPNGVRIGNVADSQRLKDKFAALKNSH